MAKSSHSGPAGGPRIPRPSTASGRAPSPSGSQLGWNSRVLLIWAITGWALASLLGILLAFHGMARRPASKTEAVALESPESTQSPPVERDTGRDSRGGQAVAPETTTSSTTTITVTVAESAEVAESNDAAIIAALLRHAAAFTESGQFEEAIRAYDEALERDPGNADFELLREQVVEMRAVVQRGGVPVRLNVRETPTEFVEPSLGGTDGLKGPDLGVSVRRATHAPEFPGELIIELRPRLIEPGDPYVVRVRLYNKGNRAIDVKSLEVVRTLGTSVEGRGQQRSPSIRRVNPRDTAVVWQESGTWRDGQASGSVAVNVTLVGDGHLKKSISW